MKKKIYLRKKHTDAPGINKMSIINLEKELENCPDIIKHRVYISGTTEAHFYYIEGFVDKNILQRDFIQPVLSMGLDDLRNKKKVYNLPVYCIELTYSMDTVMQQIFKGNSVFLCSEIPYAIVCTIVAFEKRNIEEPLIEKNIRGPHEGFVELLKTNISILRRKIKNNSLKFKFLTLGVQTNQTVAIAYIDGIADKEMLRTLYNKIKAVNIDGLPAIGYIEQSISQYPNSIFPQFQATERPDKVQASLLEGKFAVIMEGTPVVLIAPVNFFAFFQALDDYSTQWIHGSFLRLLRIASLFTALILPAIYIAVTSYHYYMVPLNMLIPLAESRSKVPFPPIIEVLILELTVEMVREAAIRLPTYIGTAISVMAGLIIGEAAVEAGIVSDLVIVIVASTAVASYVIPSYDMSLSIRILRFGYIISAAIFGIIGIIVCISLTLAHLISINSLGQPYFQPVSPLRPGDIKDAILRFPLKFMKKRPSMTNPQNKKRGRTHGKQ